MKLKRFLCALCVCATAVGLLTIPANAAEITSKDEIRLEDLRWEWVDLSTVEHWEGGFMPRANNPASVTISAHSICTVGQPVFLQAKDTVTFNCSYSPSSASIDFGVIAPNGKFYSINVRRGSINQAFEISQSGSYSIAIRNNSSQTVRVVGFVNY